MSKVGKQKVLIRQSDSDAELGKHSPTDKVRLNNHTKPIGEILSESEFFRMNIPYPDAENLFPGDIKAQYIDKLYPFAKNGPLYVDEPHYAHEIKACELKRQHLALHKMRYVYLPPNITDFEAEKQLREQESWHGQQQSMS